MVCRLKKQALNLEQALQYNIKKNLKIEKYKEVSILRCTPCTAQLFYLFYVSHLECYYVQRKQSKVTQLLNISFVKFQYIAIQFLILHFTYYHCLSKN